MESGCQDERGEKSPGLETSVSNKKVCELDVLWEQEILEDRGDVVTVTGKEQMFG